MTGLLLCLDIIQSLALLNVLIDLGLVLLNALHSTLDNEREVLPCRPEEEGEGRESSHRPY